MSEPEYSRPLPRGIIRSTESAADRRVDQPTARQEWRTVPETFVPEAVAAPVRAGVISAIELQERHSDRVNIFIGGKFALGVFADVAATLGLKIGQTIDTARLAEITALETRRKAREQAYRLLSYRARTEHEIVERLQRSGYEEELIAETIVYLRELGFLNDADFAERFSTSRSKTHGPRAISVQLRQKGIDSETIKEAVQSATDSESQAQAARDLAIRRVGEAPEDRSPAARTRLSAFLSRRGFDWDTVRSVVAELYAESGEADTPE